MQLQQTASPDAERLRYLQLKKKKALAGGGDSAQDEIPRVEKPGYGESFFRGGAQGATFGFGDEVSAGFSALGSTETDREMGRGFIDRYKLARDQIRKDNKQAEAANPKMYGLGEVAGNVATTAPLGAIAGTGRLGILSKLAAAPDPGKIFAKQGMKVLGKVALQGAKEGAILGGANALGYSEKEKVGDILTDTVGGILSGGLTGGIATPITRGSTEVTGAVLKKSLQGAHGLTNDLLSYFRKNPDKLSLARKLAIDKNGAIEDISVKGAAQLRSKLNEAVTAENEIIKSALATSGDMPLAPEPVLAAFDDEISRLKKGSISRPVRSAIGELEEMRKTFIERVQEGGYTAEGADAMRREMNDLSKKAYSADVGENPALAMSAGRLGDAFRLSLDDVSPQIREANKRLSNLINLRKDVSSAFGLKTLDSKTNDIDPSDVQKILTRFHSEAKVSDKQKVRDLADTLGVDLVGDADFVRGVKALDEDGQKWWSKNFTGKSLLLPLAATATGVAGSAGSGGGGEEMAGLGALGFILGAGGQSPLGMRLLLNPENARKATGGILDQIRRTAISKTQGDRVKGNQ
jgi:hypothetical protein